MIPASDALTKTAVLHQEIYAVELATLVLEYEDMPLLQEVVRAVRKAGGVTRAEYRVGIHVHIDGAPYTAQI